MLTQGKTLPKDLQQQGLNKEFGFSFDLLFWFWFVLFWLTFLSFLTLITSPIKEKRVGGRGRNTGD